MSERTPAQRARDDELAYLAQCGLLPDPRDEEEWQDFYYRHSDFRFFAPGHPQAHPPQARSGAGSQGGKPGRAVGPGPNFNEGAA